MKTSLLSFVAVPLLLACLACAKHSDGKAANPEIVELKFQIKALQDEDAAKYALTHMAVKDMTDILEAVGNDPKLKEKVASARISLDAIKKIFCMDEYRTVVIPKGSRALLDREGHLAGYVTSAGEKIFLTNSQKEAQKTQAERP